MFDIGAPELLIILVVALVLFGPQKLPELGRGLGRGIREFRRGTQGLHDEPEAAQDGSGEPAPLRVWGGPEQDRRA